MAAQSLHIEAIRRLVRLGFDVDTPDKHGRPPIFYVASSGGGSSAKLKAAAAAVTCLVELKADPNLCAQVRPSFVFA